MICITMKAIRNESAAPRPLNDVDEDCMLVWMDVATDVMTALPSRSAQLNTAPTVPATSGGVAAKMAMLGQG